MSRPRKPRQVCHFPRHLRFTPGQEEGPEILLTVEEYEAIRLMDRECITQEQAARQMGVGRTTLQQIYAGARQKLALALVDGRPLRIRGGDFRLCTGQSPGCDKAGCYMQTYHKMYKKPEGELLMRIAVTYENGQIFQHFGHTQYFKVYDIQDGKVVASAVVDTNGSGHGALAGVLNALNADVLICGGIGGGAQMALAAANIRLFGGVSGDADAAVEALLKGELAFNPNVRCNHHDHHGEAHTCGSHGCGSNHCGH